ncbi:unnamed protein product [Acanthosepion pharaonis]|uniref:Parvovirus non-structural protein 1 helicase domain-containing protein n=1 Tax=Acanthosepion pharaonis TaxID=158019 RepID=A0A812BC09_ACAPH|nr:unnamed protein product [Sepia pharaonis]
MHYQASDNFTFGSCINKTLIYTDKMWFTPQNVEEGKCILEGTETFINIKHQNERLLKRAPSLSTSNDDPWRHVRGEPHVLQNRMYTYYTRRPMKKLIEWGAIELNPTMWLTIWRDHIKNYVENKIDTEYINEHNQPQTSSKYVFLQSGYFSLEKKRKHSKARRNLSKLLEASDELIEGDFVVVSVNGKKTTRRYIARVDVIDGDELKGVFLKRIQGQKPMDGRQAFIIDHDDEASFDRQDIVKKLPAPNNLLGSERKSNQWVFLCDLEKFNLS